MGYLTAYTLVVHDSKAEEIIECLRATNAAAACAIMENGDTRENCKWYSHADDLEALSKEYPGVVFELTGYGEGEGDIWNIFVKDGSSKYEEAQVIFATNPFK